MTGWRRRAKRNKARGILRELVGSPDNVVIVHYSCESFYDRVVASSPRITSIAVRDYSSGQTRSWSIHQVAEEQHALDDLEQRYDDLEKGMLADYYRYVSENPNAKWVHWNMRDINYGFLALDHRYKVLGGEPRVIPEVKKYDLARILVDLYGVSYIGHPRLQRLVERNNITKKDFLTGAEEAEAFEAHKYVQLHQSTLRKVDVIAGIMERACDGSLKTNASWREIYGADIAGLYELVTDHWSWKVTSLVAVPATLVGAVLAVIALVRG